MVPHYPLPASSESDGGALYHALTIHNIRVIMLDVNFDAQVQCCHLHPPSYRLHHLRRPCA